MTVVVFSVLFAASLVPLRTALDPDPSTATDWAGPAGTRVRLALTLIRSLSTVALGSGLLFLAMVFVSRARWRPAGQRSR